MSRCSFRSGSGLSLNVLYSLNFVHQKYSYFPELSLVPSSSKQTFPCFLYVKDRYMNYCGNDFSRWTLKLSFTLELRKSDCSNLTRMWFTSSTNIRKLTHHMQLILTISFPFPVCVWGTQRELEVGDSSTEIDNKTLDVTVDQGKRNIWLEKGGVGESDL